MTARAKEATLRSLVKYPSVMVGQDEVRTATRSEMAAVGIAALLVGVAALMVCFSKGYLMLVGDAVAHLGIARRLLDTQGRPLAYLVGVWLPLPHLLMMPFALRTEWWRNGLAGAFPSLGCYVFGVVGFYRLSRRLLTPRWALAATAFYGLNPNLLYLSTTALTEPVFGAVLIWMAAMTVELADAVRAGDTGAVSRRMVALGGLIFAATMTRYDGWVLGAMEWCLVAWQLWRAREVGRETAAAFALFTALAAVGPAWWMGTEQHNFGDPLWFMRGPYSAAATERRYAGGWPVSYLGYLGMHNPVGALAIYARTAQLDAAAWEAGFAVMAAALAGLWMTWRRGGAAERSSALLWMPLVFYTVSISYGSVRMFIPEIRGYPYYNTRYGAELLPALALFAFVAVAALAARLDWGRGMYGAVLGLVGMNALAMVYGVRAAGWLAGGLHRPVTKGLEVYAPQLVLREALLAAQYRVPFERDVAEAVERLPAGATVLMAQTEHVGVLQDAGFPLRQTVNQNDVYGDRLAQEVPARLAQYAIAFDGDATAQAVAKSPGGLEEMQVVCGTAMRCAHIYRSSVYAGE
jgi:hypothetical protein